MVLDFWNEFEAIARERTIVQDTTPELRKGQTWGDKYPTVEKVLAEWRRRQNGDEGPEPLSIDLEALTAALPTGDMF